MSTSRVNPRSVILAALAEGPRTLDELTDALSLGMGMNGVIGPGGISIRRFVRLTFDGDALLARHLCKLKRQGLIERTLAGYRLTDRGLRYWFSDDPPTGEGRG